MALALLPPPLSRVGGPISSMSGPSLYLPSAVKSGRRNALLLCLTDDSSSFESESKTCLHICQNACHESDVRATAQSIMLGEAMNKYHAYYDRNHPAASVFRARLYSAKNPSHSMPQQWYCFIILHLESLWCEMPHFIRTKSGSVCTIITYTHNFSLISVIPKRRQHQRIITVMWGSNHACHRACRRPAHSRFRMNVSLRSWSCALLPLRTSMHVCV